METICKNLQGIYDNISEIQAEAEGAGEYTKECLVSKYERMYTVPNSMRITKMSMLIVPMGFSIRQCQQLEAHFRSAQKEQLVDLKKCLEHL